MLFISLFIFNLQMSLIDIGYCPGQGVYFSNIAHAVLECCPTKGTDLHPLNA